jgi:hypothetical protein
LVRRAKNQDYEYEDEGSSGSEDDDVDDNVFVRRGNRKRTTVKSYADSEDASDAESPRRSSDDAYRQFEDDEAFALMTLEDIEREVEALVSLFAKAQAEADNQTQATLDAKLRQLSLLRFLRRCENVEIFWTPVDVREVPNYR